MNRQNKKLIMFDFDGVIVDTLIPIYEINTEVNNDLSLEEFKTFFEGNIYEARRFDGTPKLRHPNFVELYKKNIHKFKIPPIIKNIIKNLHENYILVIISSTESSLINDILKEENIISYFQDILGSDVAHNKVEKVKTILNKYEIKPDSTVFITDTLGDIREAKECKVDSIAVTWGFHDKETLEKGNPIAIIDDPRDLLGVIKDVVK